MLFHSYDFLFYFLIPLLVLYRFTPSSLKMYLLTLASFVFYAQWDLLHLGLLFVSVSVNYMGARLLSGKDRRLFQLRLPCLSLRGFSRGNLNDGNSHCEERSDAAVYNKSILWGIIGFNILLLGYFKYSGFLHLSEHNMVLPLAISFYTFQQIAYVVDVYRKKITFGSFWEYLFFVMFFPQLIAGPIVHYNTMMQQVKSGVLEHFDMQKFQAGIVLFSMGMFSKVVLADNLVKERYEDWADLLSYSLMIYFDFSGYANMAIGLGLMFGVMLPLNFYSPYKARNIIEFWRRWHMTLGAFLKEHIYIPLGGSRSGYGVQMFALLATMVVGGVWHGAGWNFLLWGVMHGIGLVMVHISGIKLPKVLAVFMTFLYVTLLWVLFFSADIGEALRLYKILFSFNAFEVSAKEAAFLASGLFLVWFLPNASEVLHMREGGVKVKNWHGILAGILLFVSLKMLASTPAATFVYFNF
ncbi:MAG: MBOAT family protein [Sulfurimonas sp.]|uniref:MBOAT family O-acyltransferase n=1 Tax=Sulfurimonas sp. TaxID=2022749 RepID=UPI003D0F9567